jgi:hypothetical protein
VIVSAAYRDVTVKTCINPNGELQHLASAVLFTLNAVITAACFYPVYCSGGGCPRCSRTICSIYRPDVRSAERLWNIHSIHYQHTFDGTPFPCYGEASAAGFAVYFSEPALTAVGGR